MDVGGFSLTHEKDVHTTDGERDYCGWSLFGEREGTEVQLNV